MFSVSSWHVGEDVHLRAFGSADADASAALVVCLLAVSCTRSSTTEGCITQATHVCTARGAQRHTRHEGCVMLGPTRPTTPTRAHTSLCHTLAVICIIHSNDPTPTHTHTYTLSLYTPTPYPPLSTMSIKRMIASKIKKQHGLVCATHTCISRSITHAPTQPRTVHCITQHMPIPRIDAT